MNKEFETYILNEEGKCLASSITAVFDNALEHLKKCCFEGREFAIVKTKLEEACFFAKKSMSTNPDNQTSHPMLKLKDTPIREITQ